MKTVRLLVPFAVCLAAACGDDDASSPAESDAATPVDAASDTAPPPTAACSSSVYTTAPSGAACDSKRVQQARGLAGLCYAPAIGVGCGDITVIVSAADAPNVAAGFVCAAPVNGMSTCS